MRKMQYIMAMLVCFAGTAAHAALPVVTNVVAQQRTDTKLVDINYDVFDDDGDLLRIRVEVSDNAGNTYSVPAFTMTGDIGDNIVTGANKQIVWDAGTDWDGEYSDLMQVKVIAVDGQGLPGLEWGSEVAPGGFLMGQDGGAEDSGPSRHVNIPWSYWLSKYEIRNDQYCDFINIAHVAGDVYRVGTTEVRSEVGCFPGVPGGKLLLQIGDDRDLRWNVNNFEVVDGRSNFPVRVTWYGAMAFAQHYGYDLPTEAEWEKAARGPEHENQDTHLAYPWGDTISGGNANYRNSGDPYDWSSLKYTTPVGYYDGNQTPLGPDMANAYGLYDIIGNVEEWIRTSWLTTVESYPQQEDMTGEHNQIRTIAYRVMRGGHWYDYYSYNIKTYIRAYDSAADYTSYAGFRVARRSIAYTDDMPQATIVENFDGPEWVPHIDTTGWTVETADGTWNSGSVGNYEAYLRANVTNAYSGSVYLDMSGYYSSINLPVMSNQVPVGISLWARAALRDVWCSISYQEYDGTTWRTMESTSISGTDYQKIRLNTVFNNINSGQSFRLYRSDNDDMFIDSIEVYTVPKP